MTHLFIDNDCISLLLLKLDTMDRFPIKKKGAGQVKCSPFNLKVITQAFSTVILAFKCI